MPVRTRSNGNDWHAWVVDETVGGRYVGFRFTGNAAYNNNFLTGGRGNDTITGIAVWNNIHGDAGDDSIVGAVSGYNCLYGEIGNDSIRGGNYYDCMDGGVGDDTLYGLNGNDVIAGGWGADVIDGGNGGDTISDIGFGGTIYGGNGNDKISVNVSDAFIDGDAGNDTIEAARYVTGSVFIDDGDGDDKVTALTSNLRIDSANGKDFYDFNQQSVIAISYLMQSHSTVQRPDTIDRFNGRNLGSMIELYTLNYALQWRFSNLRDRPGDVSLVPTGPGAYDLWANCGQAGMLLVKFTNSFVTVNNIDILR